MPRLTYFLWWLPALELVSVLVGEDAKHIMVVLVSAGGPSRGQLPFRMNSIETCWGRGGFYLGLLFTSCKSGGCTTSSRCVVSYHLPLNISSTTNLRDDLEVLMKNQFYFVPSRLSSTVWSIRDSYALENFLWISTNFFEIDCLSWVVFSTSIPL